MKITRNTILSASIFVMTLTFCGLPAQAGCGKAIVPSWWATTTGGLSSIVLISNFSSHDLQVSVTFYGKNGEIATSGITYENFISSDTQLAAGSSGYVKIAGGTVSNYGYAVVEWANTSSEEDDTVALVAHAWNCRIVSGSYDARWATPVNNGKPF